MLRALRAETVGRLNATIGDLERINGAVLQRAARSQHGGLCERRHHR